MAVEKIPLSADSSYVQVTSLSGIDYQISIDYAERAGAVLLDLALDDETPLTSGLSLVPGRFLLKGFEHADRPPGDLIVLTDRDTTTLEDLGSGVTELYYVTDEDLDEYRAILAGA